MVNRYSGFSVSLSLTNALKAVFSTTKVGLRLTFLVVFAGLSAAVTASADAPGTAEDTEIITILAIGDSLTAGYGLPTGDGFVPQLEAYLNSQSDQPIRVVNAGVSGDTTSGGRSRLAWSLGGAGGSPDLVLLELGANDGLRGIDPARTRDNLDAMLADLGNRGLRVLVAGMMAPPNLGPDYAADFNPIYPDLAAKYGVPLYPFFLDGVAADPDLNQEDGIHPTKEGVAIIVARLGPVILETLLKS